MAEELFEYEFKIQPKLSSLVEVVKNIGSYWTVVEKFFLPESFVSDKGNFMFKIDEDDENMIDTWLLVLINNKQNLIDFLQEKKTYGEFLKNKTNKFYIIKFYIEEDYMILESEIKLSFILNKINSILNLKIIIDDELVIENLVNYLRNI